MNATTNYNPKNNSRYSMKLNENQILQHINENSREEWLFPSMLISKWYKQQVEIQRNNNIDAP
jgi:hypothetical protein